LVHLIFVVTFLFLINLSYWFQLVLAPNSLLCDDGAVKNLLIHYSLTHVLFTLIQLWSVPEKSGYVTSTAL